MKKRTLSIVTEYLDLHGEATKHQLADASSRSLDTIHKTIARMKEKRRVHITRYVQAGMHSWLVVPVYCLGDKADAPPPPKTNCAKNSLEEPDGLTEYRTCRVCDKSLPLTNRYFPYYNKATLQLSNRCKSCLREDNVKRRELGLPKQVPVFQRELPGQIVRKQTDHGTTLVRFGDQWRPSTVEPKRLPALYGYSSGFER